MKADVKLWVVSYDPYNEPHEDFSMPKHIIRASRCTAAKYCDDLNKKDEDELLGGWWHITPVEYSEVKELTCLTMTK